jgi:HAD superfamily hydrolase (TIGR01509 family)
MKFHFQLKLYIFDFNGTLFWDTKIQNKAWDIYLRSKGLKLTDHEKHNILHGKHNREILCMLFTRKLSDREIEKYSLEKEKIYQELCSKTEMDLAPGAIEFLDYLAKKGIKYTIATASNYYNVSFYFEKLELERFFDMKNIVYNNGKIASKPNSEIFDKVISKLGVEKNKILVFEDSLSGIKAAENASVGKIIIVDSSDSDYSDLNYQRIKNFNEVDKKIFE